MDKFYRLVVQHATSGKIAKDAAIELLKELKKVDARDDDIAITGVALTFPSAETAGDFWQNIRSGVDSIRPFPAARAADIDPYLRYTGVAGRKWTYAEGAYLEAIDAFDYEFFRLTPREAKLMDPCQRLFLQTAWQVMEDAGYGETLAGSNTGVYVGFATTVKDSYQRLIFDTDRPSLPLSVAANLPAIIPSRLSYLLDLKGPTMVVDTACSSSLLAVHLACQGIRNGDCDQAIAGGIKIHLLPLEDEHMKTGTEASDGRTRAFDHASDGAGMGEGSAAVFLKPLRKALADGDHVYAVIKGSATNQDGRAISITAPNPAAQTEVIVKAWEAAGIHPETLDWMITHGTGTKLGDPIELEGLQGAFRRYTEKKNFCALSSLKTNIGHLYECAGIANLILGALALKHGELPPTKHFLQPNRAIAFEDAAVYVNTRLRKWESQDGTPRRCGVSSFGFSGTNVHMVLEEAPAADVAVVQHDLHLLTLSAKSAGALERLVAAYRTFVAEAEGELRLADLCFTANTGRGQHPHRLALLFRDQAELQAQLEQVAALASAEWVANGFLHGVHKVSAEGDFTEAVKGERSRALQRAVETSSLRAAAALYVQGGDAKWDALYAGQAVRRLSLPVYSFDPVRCWVDMPETVQVEALEQTPLQYGLTWQVADAPIRAQREGVVLVVRDEQGVGEWVARTLRQEGRVVYEAAPSASEAEAAQMLNSVGTDLTQLVQIVYLGGLGATDATTLADMEASQARGVQGLHALVRALLATGWQQEIDVLVVAERVQEVSGREASLQPLQAPLFGYGRTVRVEHPQLHVRCVDLDSSEALPALIAEVRGADTPLTVAWREGQRWIASFGPLDANSYAPLPIQADGVHVLTGGLGGIGLATAGWLAEQGATQLALLGRTGLPDRAQWAELVADAVDRGDTRTADSPVIRAIQTIRALEARGVTVEVHSIDVADDPAMHALFTELRTRYTRICGVIHGAGTAGQGAVTELSADELTATLRPKVHGAWVLEQVTAEDALDYCVLYSSVATLFAAPGQAAYVAANAYLDALAAARTRAGRRTLTVNWTTWKETGMAKDYGFNIDTLFKAMPTQQALSALAQALPSGHTQLLLGELNAGSPMVALLDKSSFHLAPQLQDVVEAALVHRRLFSQTKSSTPLEGDVYEQQIADVLRGVLGYEEIHVHDNFFEIGADSVLLKRVHVELEQLHPGVFTIADLFEKPTVAKLAVHLRPAGDETPVAAVPAASAQVTEGVDVQDMIENMLQGNLTAEQVAAALEEL